MILLTIAGDLLLLADAFPPIDSPSSTYTVLTDCMAAFTQ